MRIEHARALTIRISQIMERWDPWSYADMIADFGDSEEHMLEYQVNELMNNPVHVIEGLLDTMECMLEKMEM